MRKRWWRFVLYTYAIVDDEETTKNAHPWWHVELPRWYSRDAHCGFAWGVFLSRGIEINFIKNKKYFDG